MKTKTNSTDHHHRHRLTLGVRMLSPRLVNSAESLKKREAAAFRRKLLTVATALLASGLGLLLIKSRRNHLSTQF